MSQISDYQKVHLDKIASFSDTVRNKLKSGGVTPDQILASEVQSEGTDQRFGVNIIARPSKEVIDYIMILQEHLRKHEPNQYYYPISDLHLTVLEISYGGAINDAEAIASKIISLKNKIMGNLSCFTVSMPQLVFSPHACGINFVPIDDGIEQTRHILVGRLLNYSQIEVIPRYSALSAHVNFARYIAPLTTELAQWVKILENVPAHINIVWEIKDIWLTWGATWYGMKPRIKVNGPNPLCTKEVN